MSRSEGSVWAAFLWMLGLSLLLGIVLPAGGTFIAGLVGGKVAGSVRNALLAALLPALLVGAPFALAGAWLSSLPWVGLFFGLSAALMVAFQSLTLLAGALVGALLFAR